MSYSLSLLNDCDQTTFTKALGSIFEDSPWIAEQTWQKRPFENVDSLYQSMVAIVTASSPNAQLTLIRSHPDLASKAKMAEASVQEQAGVGLDRLSPDEFERFNRLNTAYKQKFGFPFIIAVKNHTKDSILDAFERRLNHSYETEFDQALQEINAIAKFRLFALVT